MRVPLAAILLGTALSAQASWKRIETIGQHRYAGCAYDAVRQQVVLLGGTFSDAISEAERTWLWNGTQWTTPGPAANLPKLRGAQMAYDSQRQRVVLFGGSSGPFSNQTWHDDTWEWDGSNWLPTNPTSRPSAREGFSMAYDAARGRTVLFGGLSGSVPTVFYTDTWEWDGTNWTLRTPTVAPSVSYSQVMAYDAGRGRTVLFGGLAAAETWEWDGNNWQLVPTTAQPSARGYACMAYDPGAQRMLLFGGSDNSTRAVLDDLWQWNGSTWQMLTLSARPPARWAAAAAFDAGRGALVVFGGTDAADEYLSDTWEWDGTQWTERDPSSTPHAQFDFGLAHDSIRNRTVLFGGNGRHLTSRDETWECDGSRWRQVFPATTPPARELLAMGYDEVRGEVLMFGGSSNSVLVPAQTWTYDGIDWRLRQPTAQPGAREGSSMTFDSRRGRMLMFGGANQDTWEWDGTNWSLRTPVHVPQMRYCAGLAYDALHDRTLLFGGYNGTWLNDTWEWDGSDWTQRNPSNVPPNRERAGMAFDSVRERVVLFAGEFAQMPLGDTWEWDGNDWRLQNPAVMPPGCGGHAMVFDTARGRVVMQGGNSYYSLHGTTWDYFTANPGTVATFGSGCAGSVGVPQLTGSGRRPWLGDTFTVRGDHLPASGVAMLAIGLSNTTWNGIPLPLPLANIGMPGCDLLVSSDASLFVQSSGGTVQIPVAIPNDPRLLGLVVFEQLAVLDPAANVAGIVVSAALRAQVGLR